MELPAQRRPVPCLPLPLGYNRDARPAMVRSMASLWRDKTDRRKLHATANRGNRSPKATDERFARRKTRPPSDSLVVARLRYKRTAAAAHMRGSHGLEGHNSGTSGGPRAHRRARLWQQCTKLQPGPRPAKCCEVLRLWRPCASLGIGRRTARRRMNAPTTFAAMPSVSSSALPHIARICASSAPRCATSSSLRRPSVCTHGFSM